MVNESELPSQAITVLPGYPWLLCWEFGRVFQPYHYQNLGLGNSLLWRAVWCLIELSAASWLPFTRCQQHPLLPVETTKSVPAAAAAKSLQSCPTLCDPRDGSPPGFPVPGILQARTLEWVAIYITKCPLGNTVTPRWELLFYGDPCRTKEFQFRDCSCGPRRRNSSLDADGNHGDDKKCLGSKIYFEVRASGIFWRIRCGMREIEEPKMTWNFWSGHLRQWQFCHQNKKSLE